jgi:DNA-binding MarR family transcriptional regulator
MRLPHYEAATVVPATVFLMLQDDETLAEAFRSVAHRLRHLTLDTVTPFGITPGQARALGELKRHGGMRLSDLAEHLRIAPRSTTVVVDALQERGLAQRSPDPEDRRATVVTLTAEGERIGGAVRSARSAEAEAFFGGLSESDREALTRILRTLRE